MEEIDKVKSLAQIIGATSPNVHKPNPAVLGFIVKIIADTQPNIDKQMWPMLVYLTTKRVLTLPELRSETESMVPAIFAYYLEAYRIIMTTSDESGKTNVEYFNDAVISLFDIYLDDPGQHMPRALLKMAASTIHEVVTVVLAERRPDDAAELMGPLTDLALLTGTIGNYIDGNKRIIHVNYIRWVKDVFQKVLSTFSLDAIENDETVQKVLSQIKKNRRVKIKLN